MSLALVKKTTIRPTTVSVRCESSKRPAWNAKLNAFIDKKKELDRSRWEKLKEAARVIDHVAKSDVKETVELFKSLSPKATKSSSGDVESSFEESTEETSTP